VLCICYKVARGDQKARKIDICSDGFKFREWDLGESQTERREDTSNEINAIREWTTEGLVNHVHGGFGVVEILLAIQRLVLTETSPPRRLHSQEEHGYT
jgi:hypothetical protein